MAVWQSGRFSTTLKMMTVMKCGMCLCANLLPSRMSDVHAFVPYARGRKSSESDGRRRDGEKKTGKQSKERTANGHARQNGWNRTEAVTAAFCGGGWFGGVVWL